MDRRRFLIGSTAASMSFLSCGIFSRSKLLSGGESFEALKAKGFGELYPTAAANTGEKILALPKGFEYKVFGKTGDVMSDGHKTPKHHDGMSAFFGRDHIRIVRNHEIENKSEPGGAIADSNNYDETAGGGTTTLLINPKTLELEKDFVSLSGTLRNCAGGPTPWDSWISCEETTYGRTRFAKKLAGIISTSYVGGYEQPHGYCFEVSASANSNVKPAPIKAMGRFSHEAVAFDPQREQIYLTEDDESVCGFYRFLPKRFTQLVEGGELQILTVKNRPNADLRNRVDGKSFDVGWATIDEPDPQEADTDRLAVYKQGAAKGAAKFKKLEGCFADEKGRIYFVSSSGGDSNGGQIWLYEPLSINEGRLLLVFESPDRDVLDMPDNICIRPGSDLIFICEDSDYEWGGGTPTNFVRILTPAGLVADLAQNILPGSEEGEFTGATFSPDGDVLFVNIQRPGLTLAIRGDWSKFRSEH